MESGSLEHSSLREQLLAAFLDELSECVEAFNRDFMTLEAASSPAARGEAVERALRTAHSLKGASRIVQASDIEDACHLVEEVLVALGERDRTPELSVMQPLFATVDGLLQSGRDLANGSSADRPPLAAALAGLRSWLQTPTANPERGLPDDPTLDAQLVALHRDLGRWLENRRKVPVGSDSSRFLDHFRGVEEHLLELARAVHRSIDAMTDMRPSVASQEVPGASAAAGPPLAHRPRLLIVDDSPTMRVLQRITLEQAGYDVVVAANGMDGLQHLRRQQVDLVVMDVEMPVMDGYELTRAIRADARHGEVPIVMVTGRDRTTDRAQATRLGVDRYLVKGTTGQQELVSVIETLLAQRTRATLG